MTPFRNPRIKAADVGAVDSVAAVFAAPGRIHVQPVTVPAPGPGQVRVRLEGCGICASNLPVFEGRPWFSYPLNPGAPGHEGWGRVDAVGPGVQGINPGERVAMLSDHAYARHDLVDADALLPLPDVIKGDFPGEPLGCAMNIFARSAVRAGETVAVVGAGFMGLLLTRLAARVGARVIVLSRRAFALDLARRQGAGETIASGDPQAAVRQVRSLTGDAGCDCVIELGGEQATLDLATELTCTRGRLVIGGYHQDGPRQVNMQLWNWRGLDVVNAHERDRETYRMGMRAAILAVAGGWLDPSPLYTHRLALEELPRAFELMRTRPDGFLKALLIP